jgi:PAS domain S-box-containing protein
MSNSNSPLKIVESNFSQFLLEDDKVKSFLKQGLDFSALVAIIDSKGLISYFNAKYLETIGYSGNELNGARHPYFILDETLNDFSAQKSTRKVEYKWKKKNGEDCWYLTQFIPILNQSGELNGIVEISEDNTIRRNIENLHRVVQKIQANYFQHRSKEDLFRYLLKETLVLTNSHWGFLGEVKNLIDRKPKFDFFVSEFVNQGGDNNGVFFEENMLEIVKVVEPVINEGRVLTIRKNSISKKGAVSDFKNDFSTFLAIPIYLEDQIVGVVGLANKVEGYKEMYYRQWKPLYDLIGLIIKTHTIQDKERQIETELRDHLILLEQSQEVAKIGGWTINLDKQEVFWSRQLYITFGCDPSVFKPNQHSFAAFIDTSCVDELKNSMNGLVQRLETFDKVFQVSSHFGHSRWVRILGRPFYENGKVSKVVGALQEVSELKIKEREIEEHKAKIVSNSKMAALGEMAGGIAHEINNPLTVIQGNAKQLIIALDKGQLSDELVRKVVDKITNTTQRIAKIIKGLKSFARDGGGDPFTDCSLKMILEDTLSFCEARLKNHGVSLTITEVSGDVKVRCRPVQISQVFLNLIHNAEDEVRSRENPWINIEVQEDKFWVSIRVTDCGSGIPKDLAERIMLPFFTTKEPGKGTGLGLSIVSGIIKAHNGQFFLDQDNSHTSFIVKLPKSTSL